MFLVNMALKHFLVGQNIERLSVDFSVGLSSSVPAQVSNFTTPRFPQPRTAATQFLAEKENLKKNFYLTATDFQQSFKKKFNFWNRN